MMFKDLTNAFKTFKKNWADYLAISFAFAMIVFIGILLGELMVGLLFAYIIVIIPAIISLKFFVFQSHDKNTIEYRSLKLGFLTFFKSIRVYSIVVLKPLLFGFLAGVFVYSVFLERAIMVASDTIPNLMDSMANYDSFYYTYEEMLKIGDVSSLLNLGTFISIGVGYLVYFAMKLKRDFIPFMAFEMPINNKRAISINSKMLQKKNYFKFLLVNIVVLLSFIIPGMLGYLVKTLLEANEVFSPFTVNVLAILTFIVFASPLVTIKQLHYVFAYKTYSKPFKEDFDNELKNVIKEIEELAKKIDENK